MYILNLKYKGLQKIIETTRARKMTIWKNKSLV